MNILSVKYDFLVDVGKFRLARKALVVEYETLDYSYGSFFYVLFSKNGLLSQKNRVWQRNTTSEKFTEIKFGLVFTEIRHSLNFYTLYFNLFVKTEKELLEIWNKDISVFVCQCQ